MGISTGTLAGGASDESGRPLPAVLISVTGQDGARTTVTDARGKYIFPYLAPGHYSVRAELEGFTAIEQDDVRIGLGQRLEVSFRLKTSVQESVTVTSESPLVDVTSTTIGTNISDQLTTRIPIGRSLADIIYMAPGVVSAGVTGANFSISGASATDNVYIVDGVNITNPGLGGLGAVATNQETQELEFLGGSGMPVEMIQEVQVITGGFEPQYGEAQGGVINVITKSGANHFHGSLYNYFAPPASGDALSRENHGIDAGVDVGGPIIRNKLFFYGAYNLTATNTTLFLLPDSPGYAVVKDVTEKNIANSYSIKINDYMTASQTLGFSASGDPSYRPLSNHDRYQLDTAVNPFMGQSEWHYGTNGQVLRWSATLSPNMFVEAQAARAHNEYKNSPASAFQDMPRIVDDATNYDLGGFGGNIDFIGNNLEYSAKFTNLWKQHQFRYGVQFEDISFSENFIRTGGPFKDYNGVLATGGYRIDILPPPFCYSHNSGEQVCLEDTVYQADAALTPPLEPTTTRYLNWFAQDSWDLTPELHLTLGVRWEQQQIKGNGPGSTGVTFSNNWAPRIGAAYDYRKNGKSKVFFHYGRFLEKLPNSVATSFDPYIFSDSYYLNEALTQSLLDHPGDTHSQSLMEVEGHGNSSSSYRTAAEYSDEWVAGMEQEVRPGFSLGARFIFRNMGRVVEDIQLNQAGPCIALPNGGCIQAPVTIEDAAAGAGTIGLLTNVDGHIPGIPALVRAYKALEITLERRFSNRWQLAGSYRYAQLTGNYEGGNQNMSAAGDYALSPFTQLTWAEGPLPNDVRHMVKLFGSYQLRADLSTGVAFYFQTGSPITALTDGGFGTFILTPRGALGRTDAITSLNVNAAYSMNFHKSQKITLGVDVFNLFDFHGVIAVNQVKEIYDTANPSRPSPTQPDFLNPTEYQPSRTVRVSVKYTL